MQYPNLPVYVVFSKLEHMISRPKPWFCMHSKSVPYSDIRKECVLEKGTLMKRSPKSVEVSVKQQVEGA